MSQPGVARIVPRSPNSGHWAQSRDPDQHWNLCSVQWDPWATLPEGHHHSKLRGERSADQWLRPFLASCTHGTRPSPSSGTSSTGCTSGVRSPIFAPALGDVHCRGWAGQADAHCHQSDLHRSPTCECDDDVSKQAEGLVVEHANMTKRDQT